MIFGSSEKNKTVVLDCFAPVNNDVEDYQGDDWKHHIEKGVHPQEVDVEIPVVEPHPPPNQSQVAVLASSEELTRRRNRGRRS